VHSSSANWKNTGTLKLQLPSRIILVASIPIVFNSSSNTVGYFGRRVAIRRQVVDGPRFRFPHTSVNRKTITVYIGTRTRFFGKEPLVEFSVHLAAVTLYMVNVGALLYKNVPRLAMVTVQAPVSLVFKPYQTHSGHVVVVRVRIARHVKGDLLEFIFARGRLSASHLIDEDIISTQVYAVTPKCTATNRRKKQTLRLFQ